MTRSTRTRALSALLPALWLVTLVAATSGDTGKVPQGLEDKHAEGTDLWIYNDLAKAMTAARISNKPIFVTFRCVPCKACSGFDAEVAKGNEGVHELARQKFISVRQVEMKGVDLNLFQFDHDLNWAAMFINADGTVYARYGTQSAEGPDAYNSLASLEKTMQRVLQLHKDYPKNKSVLAAKRGADRPYRTALEMPGLINKEKLAGPTARNNCIHCHNIHDAQQRQWYSDGTFSIDKLYRFPLPENVGLHIVRDDGRRVERVDAGSPADAAGLKPGDDITHVNGQAITSIADIQWVLQNLPNEDAKLTVTAARDGQSAAHTLTLAKGWKKIDFSWRGSMWSLKPNPGFWAPALDENQVKSLGLPADVKPLRVQFINGNRPEGRAAREAGLHEGDVIIALAGKPIDMTPKQFHLRVRLDYKVGDKLPLTVLRGGQKKEVVIKLTE
jgi:serine protease Do